MAENINGTPYNADVIPLIEGMIVRISATDRIVRAQADSAPHMQGLCGVVSSGVVAPGGPTSIVQAVFKQRVLMDPGLVLSPGQTIYVSAVNAGLGSNLAAGVAVAIGTIEDTGSYLRDGSVLATVNIPADSTGGGGGAQGFQGAQGSQGAAGSNGSQGSQGAQGAQGSQGAGGAGAQGAQGSQGSTGSQGAQGASGTAGSQGAQGASGSQGFQGAQGVQGSQGFQGNQGVPGSAAFGSSPPTVARGNVASAGSSGLASQSDAVNAQTLVADWSTTVIRTFLYDPVNGSDTNPGFSDGAGPYNPATQARKTAAGMQAVMPANYAGRIMRLLVASGTYANPDLDQILGGATGLGSGSLIRGTATNATASCTAFADDINDRIFCGATTATGCNAGGYNPTAGSTTTVIPCQLNGGGAAGFAAEPASPLGWRLRFDSATTTAALRNVCVAVIKVAGGNTITSSTALPATPSTSDVFYLEQANVVLPSVRLGGLMSNPTVTATPLTGLQMVGVRTTGTFQLYNGSYTLALCGSGTGVASSIRSDYLRIQTTYTNPTDNTTVTPGGGFRCDGTSIGIVCTQQATAANVVSVGSIDANGIGSLNIDGVAGAGFFSFSSAPASSTFGFVFGNPVRVIGPGDAGGFEFGYWLGIGINNGGGPTIDVTNSGSLPALVIIGKGATAYLNARVTGSTGNNDVGLDLSQSINGTIIISNGNGNPTVTGALGDVRLSDGTIISWATAAAGVIDPAGNVLFAPPNYPIVRPAVATWPMTTIRTFLYDPVNGNDGNPGYSDGAGPYTPNTQAKKTANGLQSVMPRDYAGRQFRLLMASGAYSNADLDQLLSGSVGIGSGSLVRGTGTNATASATAFQDDANDRIFEGAVTATNANASGYNPTAGATTTSVPCQLNGGGAAGLPAEPASPLGWRIRFDSATATSALRNVCRAVIGIPTSATITTDTALPAVPGLTDVFYLEMAGVAFPTIRLGGITLAPTATTTVLGLQISGVRSLGLLQAYDAALNWSFSGCPGGAATMRGNFTRVSPSYVETTTGGTITVGGGFRAGAGASLLAGAGSISCNNFCGDGTLTLQTGCSTNIDGVWGQGFTTSSLPASTSSSIGAQNPLRVLSASGNQGILVDSSLVGGANTPGSLIQVTGVGAKPAIKGQGAPIFYFGSNASGSTGNTDVGLDLTQCAGALIAVQPTPTITGALGDIRTGDGTIVSWVQIVATGGFVDGKGNRFVCGLTGTGVPLSGTKFSGGITGGVGATLSYCSDTGPVATNQTTALRYATSLRLARRLRVTCLSNTSVNAVTVTLYKNGVATAMQVSIPAGTAANTKFVDTAHSILFLDGDDYDFRLDDGAGDAAGIVTISGAIEWAS